MLRTRNILTRCDYCDFLALKCERISCLKEVRAKAHCCSSLYGGLAQQEPVDPRGIMCRLRQLAKHDDKVCYLGQYDNDNVSDLDKLTRHPVVDNIRTGERTYAGLGHKYGISCLRSTFSAQQLGRVVSA